MEITGVLWDSCPDGIDCERVYNTDGSEVAVQFKWDKVLTPAQAAARGVALPDDEGLLLFPRQGWAR